MSDSQQFTDDYLSDLGDILNKIDSSKISEAISLLTTARDDENTIFVCGNGGSGAIASEFATDMNKTASEYGKRFKVMALTDSVSTITAYANDDGYETVFANQLRNFAKPNDILVAISGSGNSENILNAVNHMKSIGGKTIGLTGSEMGKLKDSVDIGLLVPSVYMAHLEDCFYIFTHVLTYAFTKSK